MKLGSIPLAALLLAGFVLLSVPASANQMAVCAPDFSTCEIPENVLLDLPFLAIAGDVVLFEPDGVTISDVFRILNDVVDTGGGTGLGDLAFLYSSDDSTPLPDPSTFSGNAQGIFETGAITAFDGNGTTYFLGAPEPSTLGLLCAAAALVCMLGRKRVSR
jgi:hypothetical protein